ncbi:hypothetical protein ACIOMM_20090 [Streptomyces sp. NPDC087908]|uniref:hypothetical protein n=1 Tax=unclassified Streptomyces TaxID=2593676 RepID=UPI0011CDDF3B|nr:hypothetical protein [Streptomyces sp. adm13(2018)]TXS16013.1 hypothetical protein EAO70_15280 [Streptomyces sp. adm13(2018)]
MNVELFAHPLSFRRHPQVQADRLAAHGVDGVHLAFSYHGGRWLLTTSDPCAVVDFRAGQWFRDEAVPVDGNDLALPALGDDATTATTALLRAGLGVTAWLVGLHQSGPATRHPESALRNAFGHHYRHALCPARPEVRAYATDLVARTARRPGVTGLELEAFGYLGWQHQSAHDKLGAALRPVDRWLLSLCFCSACAELFTHAGIDVPALAETVRAALLAQLAEPREAGDLEVDARTALGSDLHDTVLAVRSRTTVTLVRDAVAAADGLPVSLRSTSDPYACDGKSAADTSALAAAAGALTVTDLSGNHDALRRELASAARTGAQVTVGWNLAVGRTTGEQQLADVARDAYAAGARSLALYAYDLAPAQRLAWLSGLSRPIGCPDTAKPAPPPPLPEPVK